MSSHSAPVPAAADGGAWLVSRDHGPWFDAVPGEAMRICVAGGGAAGTGLHWALRWISLQSLGVARD